MYKLIKTLFTIYNCNLLKMNIVKSLISYKNEVNNTLKVI